MWGWHALKEQSHEIDPDGLVRCTRLDRDVPYEDCLSCQRLERMDLEGPNRTIVCSGYDQAPPSRGPLGVPESHASSF